MCRKIKILKFSFCQIQNCVYECFYELLLYVLGLWGSEAVFIATRKKEP